MAKIKAGLLSLRDLFATAWWIFLIVGIGFVVAYQFVKPAPPSRIVISTGSESGAYYQFAKRYAAILARDGIGLEVRSSAGSLENIARLKAGEVDVGFVQGGVIIPPENDEEDDSGLLSLGSLFYEPVWVFYRGERKIDRLTDLHGKRIAIGQEGSGVRQLAQQLLAANEIPTGDHLVPLSGLKAAEELQQGRIDAAFIFGSMASGTESAGSDIDLMVVGDAGFAEVVDATYEAQAALGREINPKVMSASEWQAKKAERNAFLQDVLNKPRIMLIGDADAL